MSGSMWLKEPGPGRDTLPFVPRQRTPSWAAADPVDELTERLQDFIAAAVHPDEIAALLESDGLTDDQIRLQYGREDSFTLAEELYARVERRFPEPADGPAVARGEGLLACLLRGLIFALPGLGYVLGAPLLEGGHTALGLPPGAPVMLAGALAGWTWNQALAHRAYCWLGLGDRAAAARCLLLGGAVGALFGTAAALAAAGRGDGASVLFAAGQALYLAAATALLVLALDRELLASLLPLAGGALCAAQYGLPSWARVAVLLASVAAAAVLAVQAVLRELPDVAALLGRRTGRGRGAAPWPGASLPYGLFGLGTGVLVLYAALGAPQFAVALSLSMGPAEWLLHRFRADGIAGLRGSTSPRGFRGVVAAALARCLAGYLGALVVVVAAVLLLWPGGGARPDATSLAGLLLLGVVLWTGLVLQAFGAVRSASVACCAAALVTALSPDAGVLVVPGVTAVVLASLVCVLLGRVTAHR